MAKRSAAQREADKKYEEKRKGTRFLTWTAVVYPESAPENWRDYLDETHIEWVESPLHDQDVNPDGTPKKSHWHILLMFQTVKTAEQVKELLAPLNCTIPIVCQSAKGLCRYMAHLDNPEKFQYSISEIRGHGGADIAELLRPTSSDRYETIKAMIEWVKDNQIVDFIDLMDYAMSHESDTWFPLLCDNSAFVMKEVIKSNWQKVQRGK